jgi:uncharacterized RmlC-like cupin family protein
MTTNIQMNAIRAARFAGPLVNDVTSERGTTLGGRPVCTVLRAQAPIIGKQGFSYAPAVSAETVGASAMHMQLVTIPPGARAKAHKHAFPETAIYVLSGESAM